MEIILDIEMEFVAFVECDYTCEMSDDVLGIMATGSPPSHRRPRKISLQTYCLTMILAHRD
jgi:hypothetical protein